VPPTPARMKLLALVLALSVNSKPSSLGCTTPPLGLKKPPSWRTMATKRPRRSLTRRAREFVAFWGLTTQAKCARLIIGLCSEFISSGDPESPVIAPEVGHDAETFDYCHFTNPYCG